MNSEPAALHMQPTISDHYRPDIDGLRAIAVLAVVGFHLFPERITGGFIGVDIFFVISGFLISLIIFENLKNDDFDLRTFYARRIRRIFPALCLILLSCLATGSFILFADEYKQLGKHTVAGAGFVANFVYWTESGYFDVQADLKPLLHLWSLGIEEQFYIIWPIALWFVHKKRLNLLALILIAGLASFALNIYLSHSSIASDFYLPFSRFWELLSGSVLAWLVVHNTQTIEIDGHFNNRIMNGIRQLISLAGLVLIVYGIFQLDKTLQFPGVWALIPTLGAACIIWAGPSAWINNSPLSHKIPIFFGLISYPLYLWHWPLLVFSRIYQGEFPSRNARIGIALLSIILAWLTYRWIEQPIRRYDLSKVSKWLFLMLTCLGFTGYLIYIADGMPNRDVANKFAATNYTEEVPGYLPCNLRKGLENSTLSKLDINYCVISVNSLPNKAIIGDSHAEDKFHGLVDQDLNNNWILLGNSNCPPVTTISFNTEQKDCKRKFESIYKYLEEDKDIKEVVLSFYGIYFKKNNYLPEQVRSNDRSTAYPGSDWGWQSMFYAGLDSAIKELIRNGKKVTLMIDVPELEYHPKDCVRNPFKKCEKSLSESIQAQIEMREMIQKLEENNPKLTVFDPLKTFCSASVCSYMSGNSVLYRDSNHLGLAGSQIYAKDFLSNQ